MIYGNIDYNKATLTQRIPSLCGVQYWGLAAPVPGGAGRGYGAPVPGGAGRGYGADDTGAVGRQRNVVPKIRFILLISIILKIDG